MGGSSRPSKNKLVILGRAGMDIYADPPGSRTEEATGFFSCLGGSSANIAVAAVRLGGQASLVTCVSDDAVGRFCLNELAKYGVDASRVRTVGGEARTSLAIIESRVEDHQSVIYRNGAADFEMSMEDVSAVSYTEYGALVATGTALAAEPSRSAALHAFGLARSAGLPLALDLDYRPYSWPSAEAAAEIYAKAAGMCDIVVGNDDEFGVMAGAREKGLGKARELADSTASVVIYKMGERGAIALSGGQEIRTGIYEAKTLKPTGAGDSFMGGFLSSWAQGRDLRDSVLRGSACASMVVSRVGCAPAMPSADELEEFLRTHPGVTEAKD